MGVFGMKRYKVMAYVLSTGLWDSFGSITLETMLGVKDEELESELAQWQALYDSQFKRHSYEFDWDLFNEMGRALTKRIGEKLPPHTDAYYEPSDDREFFSPDECNGAGNCGDERMNEMALREQKRTLIHMGISTPQMDSNGI